MRTVIATCLFLVLAAAWAWRMPADAQVVLTAQDGRIVGVGFASSGERFDLELLPDFEGSVRLLVVSLEGGARALRAIVTDGVVYVDTSSLDEMSGEHDVGVEPLELEALTVLLEASGFERIAVGPPAAMPAGAVEAGSTRGRDAAAANAATGAGSTRDERGDDRDARASGRADEATERAQGMARDRDDEHDDEDGAGPPTDDERPGPPASSRP